MFSFLSTENSSTENSSTGNSSPENSSTENSSPENSSTENSSTENSSTENSSTENSSTENSSTENSSTENSSTALPASIREFNFHLVSTGIKFEVMDDINVRLTGPNLNIIIPTAFMDRVCETSISLAGDENFSDFFQGIGTYAPNKVAFMNALSSRLSDFNPRSSGNQPSGDESSGDQPSGDQPSDNQPSDRRVRRVKVRRRVSKKN